MIIFAASILTIGVLVFILSVRTKDLPEPEPVSPFQHLDERTTTIAMIRAHAEATFGKKLSNTLLVYCGLCGIAVGLVILTLLPHVWSTLVVARVRPSGE